MEIKPKFQIGDIVYLKGRKKDNSRLFITEIRTVTCTAGTQILYIGKCWFTASRTQQLFLAGTEEEVLAHSYKPIEYNEIELDCVVEEQQEMYNKRKE